MKPRASMGPPPGIPTPRRRSMAPSQQPPRPPSALDDSAEAIAQLQAAMSKHNPLTSPEYRPPPARRMPSTASMASSSRSVTPASPTRPRPKTPSFTMGAGATPARRAPPLPSTSLTVPAEPQIGDTVKALGFEGVLRFLGGVSFKEGTFAGIELMGTSRGKGKNDGSVQGEKYFTCDPLCGLFVPASKVELVFQRPFTPALSSSSVLPRPPSTTPRPNARAKSSAEAARAAEAKITQGSRASKYLTMTAAQLATRQAALGISTPARRAASPEKPSTPFSSSTASSATPRNRARPSIGLPTPSRTSIGGRKSVGGAAPTTPTPRTAYKRPPSSMGTSSRDTPEVPPLPLGYASGRMTPSRRTSEVSSVGGPFDAPSAGRPETPARSVSRSSNFSISSSDRYGLGGLGRPSSRLSRSGASTIADDNTATLEAAHREAIDALQADKAVVQRRADEAKAAQSEAERQLKTSMARFEELRLRLESAEARSTALEARMTASGGEASRLRDEADDRLQDLEARLLDTERARREAVESLEAKSMAQVERQTTAERQLEEVKTAFATERRDLNAQLDQLREAGQALCGVYEERLDAAEGARMQVEETLRATEEKLEAARSARAPEPTAMVPQSPRTEAPSPSALAIDNESLRAEVEHLRGRVGTLEEHLEEARANLETEVAAGKQKRQESGDAATSLKNEVKALKDRLEQAARKETATAARVTELDHALRESRTTLERERAELEGLRADATSSANADALQRQLDAMRAERDAARKEATDAAARAADVEEELRLTEELYKAEKASPARLRADLDDDDDAPGTPSRSATVPSAPGNDITQLKAAHERELHARDHEIRSLRSKLSSSTSMMPAPSQRDEVAALGDELAAVRVIVERLDGENRELSEANARLRQDLEVKGAIPATNGTLPSLQHVESELAEVKRKLEDAERRSAREVKALNQEVAELESLVEAKIFKEDELSDELDRYRQLVAKAQEQGFSTSASSSAKTSTRPPSSSATVTDDPAADACELCGVTGHEIESCPIFGGDSPSAAADGQAWCEDCETAGHSAENCPVSLETF